MNSYPQIKLETQLAADGCITDERPKKSWETAEMVDPTIFRAQGDTTDAGVKDAREATLALLARRAPAATICPSEVARALVALVGAATTAGDWRDAMAPVHAAIDQLSGEGLIRLSWKGAALTTRAGPYRIGRNTPDPQA